MKCEMCDREARLNRVLIEGAEMMVCPECSRYGTVLSEKKTVHLRQPKKKTVPYSKDVFSKMDEILVADWGQKIAQARAAKGLTREQLGAKVGQPTVTIGKIENQELRPPDETVRRIERELGISLFQKVEGSVVKKTPSSGLTIGDLLKDAK
jgi:putative transcription factor